MAKECIQKCPVIKAIQRNVESDLLPGYFEAGLNSAIRASDECQGPGEKEDGQRNGRTTITLAEPLKVCGYFESIKDEPILTPE